MPRVKSSPKKYIKTANGQPVSKSLVFILENEGLESSEGLTGSKTSDVVKLRHPRSGEGAMFLFSPDNKSVQEIFTFSENKRSWFINDTVKEDGKMHLSTPVDPLFLLLPYLKKSAAEGKVLPLCDLLVDDGFPAMQRLIQCCGVKNINMVADRKGDEELNAWKYNEEKTLSWLKKKTERVTELLKQKNINVHSGAVSNTFIKSDKDTDLQSELYISYAFGLISEYLQDDLSYKLHQYLGLPEEKKIENTNKRKSQSLQSESKKIKHDIPSDELIADASTGLLDLSRVDKTSKLSAKEKAKIKSASGTKNITEFFKKK